MATRATTGPLLSPSTRSTQHFSAPYAVLSAVHMLLGVLLVAMPLQVGRVLFGHHGVHEDTTMSPLLSLFSAVFFGGAAIAWALKNAADTGTILNPEGQRLKASLILLASGSIILHLAYIHTLTWWGLSLGALAMGATLMIPLVTLGVGNARLLSPANIVGGVATGISTLISTHTVTSLASALFALITLVFVLAGLAYLCLPHMTISAVFGADPGPPATFVWQHLGLGLLVAVPTLTFVLTDAANNAWLEDVVARTLSMGLLVLGVLHLAVLVPVMTRVGVHWLTLVLSVSWAGGVLAAVVGMAVAQSGGYQRGGGYGPL